MKHRVLRTIPLHRKHSLFFGVPEYLSTPDLCGGLFKSASVGRLRSPLVRRLTMTTGLFRHKFKGQNISTDDTLKKTTTYRYHWPSLMARAGSSWLYGGIHTSLRHSLTQHPLLAEWRVSW